MDSVAVAAVISVREPEFHLRKTPEGKLNIIFLFLKNNIYRGQVVMTPPETTTTTLSFLLSHPWCKVKLVGTSALLFSQIALLIENVSVPL